MKNIYPLIALSAVWFTSCSTTPPSAEITPKKEVQYSEVIKPHEAAIQACYKKNGKGLPIDLTVNFQTNFSGQLQSVEINKDKTSPTSPTPLNECVLKEFSKVEFPKVDGEYKGVRGSYSFHFEK
jgi:hypothetical protein